MSLNEATHSSLDLIEKQTLLITFEKFLTKKNGPVCSPNGPMLEFEITGDRNNFVDQSKIMGKNDEIYHKQMELI